MKLTWEEVEDGVRVGTISPVPVEVWRERLAAAERLVLRVFKRRALIEVPQFFNRCEVRR